jgi:hypothetical protein
MRGPSEREQPASPNTATMATDTKLRAMYLLHVAILLNHPEVR